ncbi:hypothetical protein HI914_00092 [Erysiphe necator]|nr:hypothetical protein HI914_00092 [Erysiphe necator]
MTFLVKKICQILFRCINMLFLDRRYPTVKFSLIDSANLSYCSDSSNSDTPEYFLYVDGDMPDDMVTLTQRNIEKLIKDQLI